MNLTGVFGVRIDNSRGILIETIEAPNGVTYFFKFRDQPLARHCEQVQNIIRKAEVKRAKKIKIDMTNFILDYWSMSDEMRINKEIGAIRRAATEKNQRLAEKLQADELRFQAARIQRIHEVCGLQGRGQQELNVLYEEAEQATLPNEDSDNME